METKNPIVYVASPLGFSESGRLFHDSVLLPMIREIGFDIRNPWVLTPKEILDSASKLPYGQEKKERWSKVNQIVGQNNAKAIEEADIIIAILDGSDVESGTSSEIGYGSALGKTIIGYRGDFRLSSENEGGIVSLQVEYFIRRSGGEIVTTVEALKTALIAYREKYLSNRKT